MNNLSDFSPGGSSLGSLSLDLGDLSIDNTSSPKPSSLNEHGSNANSSNISSCDSNISIAYSLSFEEFELRPAAYSVNSKRKLRTAPKLSVDSLRRSGYSPLATNILNVNNSGLKQKRFSEFFRSEMSSLNLGEGNDSFSDKDSFKNLSLDSDKDDSFKNLSTLDSDKENLSNLSIDDKSVPSNKVLSSSRYSEHFRSEVSHLHLSSPDISFDLPESPKNSNLSLVLTDSSRENSIVKKSPEKPPSEEILCRKPRSYSEHFRNEVSQLDLSSPDISFDLPESPKNKNLSLEFTESSRENSFSKPNQINTENVRRKKESDEDGFDLAAPARRGGRKNMLESSDEEEEADVSTVSEINESYPEEIRANNYILSDDEEYENSFIDDEALEGDETGSEDGGVLTSDSSASDDGGAFKGVQTPDSSSDDDYETPGQPNVAIKETPFFTTRTDIKMPNHNPTNLYKTPTSFCHSPSTPAAKNVRRRTCLAMPLSVKTKTGTPGQPNRTYNRNLLTAARELFQQFNEFVFNNELPSDLEIKVNKRLNTTAGRCVYMRKGEQYKSHIELSPKVVDCLERLKETLAHELCHAATFIIDKKMDNHGPLWKRWARRVNTKYPELPPVSRCHSYQIQYKYNYKCSEGWCNYTIGRHSKSVDLDRARCPLCYSRLTLPNTSQTPGKTPNKWTEFVKTRFSQVKENQPPRTPHKDLMKILSAEFKDLKTQNTI
ncbi:germ cell nuclear acidic protein-like [Bolinopsis microptera]|uniref:germ cell nuclear acidic protein-like n=1 Tax=Bolinopsis microptera TaxID=2820187 RepID=UPI00307986F6